MLSLILLPLLASLTAATSRDTGKVIRTIPTISNSLVNLGKMDISLYFNGKPQDIPTKPDHAVHPFPSLLSKFEPIIDEPCPCSNFRNMKDSFLTNPSEIINKILRSNDLFPNKGPITSNMCCDTHEHVEDTVYFEMTPNQKPKLNPINPSRTNSITPFTFNSGVPDIPISSPLKSKAIEIYLFPRRKDIANFEFTKMLPQKSVISKDGIQIVGDKVLKKDFKPVVSASSVKKDLTENIAKKDESNKFPKVKEDENTKLNAL